MIYGGNSGDDVDPVIKVQSDSLETEGIEIGYFPISGKGALGYLKAIRPLRKTIRENNYSLIHSHYSFSGFAAALTGARPLVVSLMGSDVMAKSWYKYIIYPFYRMLWDAVIVKSEEMKQILGYKNVTVLPNGVNMNIFKPIDQKTCQTRLNWNAEEKHILFAGNPYRPEKNFDLMKKAFKLLKQKNKNCRLHTLVEIPHKEVPVYMNAADVVVLTSFREGSPNVIKEAMACNRSVVSTDVGDVRYLFEGVDGCFLTLFEPRRLAADIEKSFACSVEGKRVQGRQKLMELGLDSGSVAGKLLDIYNETLEQRKK